MLQWSVDHCLESCNKIHKKWLDDIKNASSKFTQMDHDVNQIMVSHLVSNDHRRGSKIMPITSHDIYTPIHPPTFNIAPENKHSQKESSLPTIIFQGAMIKLPGFSIYQQILVDPKKLKKRSKWFKWMWQSTRHDSCESQGPFGTLWLVQQLHPFLPQMMNGI